MATVTMEAAALAGVRSDLNLLGEMTTLEVDVNVSYASEDGMRVGRMITVDAWALMTEEQRAALQSICASIVSYVASTYA